MLVYHVYPQVDSEGGKTYVTHSFSSLLRAESKATRMCSAMFFLAKCSLKY